MAVRVSHPEESESEEKMYHKVGFYVVKERRRMCNDTRPIEIIIVWDYPWGACQDLFSCLPRVANASDLVFEYCNSTCSSNFFSWMCICKQIYIYIHTHTYIASSPSFWFGGGLGSTYTLFRVSYPCRTLDTFETLLHACPNLVI